MTRQTKRPKAVSVATSKARQGQASCPCHPAQGQSRVIKFHEGFAWDGIERQSYKDADQPWRGVSRVSLVGGPSVDADAALNTEPSVSPPFHVRYFEIEPGGYSTRERHGHAHVVTVLRGRGTVTLGDEVSQLGFGDVVYVAPWEIHQFANRSASEPFGFLCVVPAQRDRPEVVPSDAQAPDGRDQTERASDPAS